MIRRMIVAVMLVSLAATVQAQINVFNFNDAKALETIVTRGRQIHMVLEQPPQLPEI